MKYPKGYFIPMILDGFLRDVKRAKEFSLKHNLIEKEIWLCYINQMDKLK